LIVKVPDAYRFSTEDSENFGTWLARADGDTTIVILWEKADERIKLVKYLSENDAIVDCPVPDKKNLPDWLIKVFKLKGLDIKVNIANLILERAGDNLLTLLAEAEKLSLYPGPGKPISEKEIRELVSLGPVSVIFELNEPVGERALYNTIPVFLDLWEFNTPISLISALETHLMRLYSLKLYYVEAQASGKINPNAALDFGYHPFYLQKLKAQISRWTLDELKDALVKLENTHKMFVTTKVPQDIIFEELLIDLGLSITIKKKEGLKPL
jgi:DNA polymerase III delta subunit